MKLARLLGLAVIFTGVFFAAFAEDATDMGEPQYVEVKKAFPNVYAKLDPKSEIIRQVKKGEYLELLRKGVNGVWYEVKVDGRVGYLEATAGKVVNRKGAPVITLLLYIFLLLACAGGVALYIKKQQIAPSASGVDDIDDDLDDDDELR
jgi:hypothetical protein